MNRVPLGFRRVINGPLELCLLKYDHLFINGPLNFHLIINGVPILINNPKFFCLEHFQNCLISLCSKVTERGDLTDAV